jgi:DNA-binding LacI/PurR family transcriptional regulator
MSRGGYLPPTLLVGLDMAMRERNVHLSISDLPNKVAKDGVMGPKLLRELLADGLLINYDPAGMPAELVKRIDAEAVPSIWINMDRPGDCVGPDDIHGGEWAARELIEAGGQRLAMLSPTSAGGHISVKHRREGFLSVVDNAGLVAQVIEQDPNTRDPFASIAELVELFRQPDRPDAFFAYESEEAGRVLMAAAAAGLRIPDDIKIIATSAGACSEAGLPIAHVVIPFGEIGCEAVDLLYARLDRPGKPLPPRKIPYRHIDRGVTLGRTD